MTRAARLGLALPRATFASVAVAGMLSGCHLFDRPEPEPPPPPLAAPAESGPQAVELPPLEPAEPPAAEPQTEQAGVQTTGGETRGRLSKAAIERTVTAALPAFEACYRAALDREPKLSAGRVLVNFVVAPDGSVPYAAALDSGTTLTDDTAIDCILDEFQKLQFEPPQGGKVVSTYPLEFAPAASP